MRIARPVAAALLIYVSVFAVQLLLILRLTHGEQLYPLDDVYIHAAVAKNLYVHHIYGISQYHYSFPSSSILWPFVLALAFAITGVHAWVPLAVNFLLSLCFLSLADSLLRALVPAVSSLLRFASLLLICFGMPLIGLSFEGMEHVAQAVSILLVLLMFERARVNPSAGRYWSLGFAALFAVGIRYEGLFVVLMVLFLLVLRRRWIAVIKVGSMAILPALAFGIFARLHGSTFLPAPLLLKTSASTQTSLFTAAKNLFSMYSILSGTCLCFVLTAVIAGYLVFRGTRRTEGVRDVSLCLLGTFFLHAQLAHFGWLFRYEAYLIGGSIVVAVAALGILINEGTIPFALSPQTLQAAVLILLTVGLAGRGESMLRGIPRNARAIYEQQYQTARFLARFYPKQVVGLNDIGAPDFFADIRCVDLLGLASSDVAMLRKRGQFTRDAVAELSDKQGIRIAALYPGLFADQIPEHWIAVSSLEVIDLKGKVQLGERKVTLYAVNPAEAEALARHVAEFQGELPDGVAVRRPDAPDSLEASVTTQLPRRGRPAGKLLAWIYSSVDDLNNFQSRF